MASKKIKILIPPSEGKTAGGKHPALGKTLAITGEILTALNTYEGSLEKLYGLKEKALQKATEANKKVLSSKTLPAIERYSGVVYDGIHYPTLSNKKYFGEHVFIVSALFGLISASTLIPDYKLKIDKLKAAQKWKEHNSALLKDCFIIDLLPHAHRKAVSYSQGIRVEFVIIKNGKNIPAGHNGKLVKGKFVRWLVENEITDISRFVEFTEEGYEWDGEIFLKRV